MPEDDPLYELGSIAAAVRRRVGVVVLLTVLAAGAALAVSLAQPDRYEATATLLFRAPGLDEQIFDRPVLIGGSDVSDGDTNAGLVALDAVAERTEGTPGSVGTAEEIAEAITVGQGAGPGLVEVTAGEENPEDAASLANAYALAYVEVRRTANRRDIERARSFVERELMALPPRLRTTSQADDLRRQIKELEALAVLQIAEAEVVEEASPPTSASSPKPLRNAILGGLAGLVFGLAAALLLERLSGYGVVVTRRG